MKILTSLLFQGFDAPSSNTKLHPPLETFPTGSRIGTLPFSDQVCQKAEYLANFNPVILRGTIPASPVKCDTSSRHTDCDPVF